MDTYLANMFLCCRRYCSWLAAAYLLVICSVLVHLAGWVHIAGPCLPTACQTSAWFRRVIVWFSRWNTPSCASGPSTNCDHVCWRLSSCCVLDHGLTRTLPASSSFTKFVITCVIIWAFIVRFLPRCIVQYCYSKSSIRPSVCDIDVPWAYVLAEFETTYMSNKLSVFTPQSHKIGNLVQGEQTRNSGGIEVGSHYNIIM